MGQIIANIGSSQYGGQSIDMSHLAKYLRISFEKHMKNMKESCPELSEKEIEKISRIRTREELRAGIQAIFYNLNTLVTSNGQVPFEKE